jgi:hypothetical protein
MSVSSFVPQIWSASILRGFEKASVFTSCLSREYAGEVRNQGDMVKVPKISAVAVRDYVKGQPISYDEVSGSTLDIPIDQCKYFGLRAEDVDILQSAPNFLDGATQNASYALRDTIDMYSAEVLTGGAGVKLYEGNPYDLHIPPTGVIGSCDDANINLFTTLAMELDQLNVPRSGRFCVIPPYVVKALSISVIKAGIPNTAPLSDGFITRIAGFDIFMSNNLVMDSDDNATIIAGVREAGTHIVQISRTESLRDQNQFGDLVRGLALYKTAVLLPEGLVTALVQNPKNAT